MASDDEQPPQGSKKWCACIPWKSDSTSGPRNPVADQEQPRLQNPTAVQDTRLEAPVHAGPAINDTEAPVHTGPVINDPEAPVNTGPAINDPEAPVNTGPAINDPEAPVNTGPVINDPEAPVHAGPAINDPEANTQSKGKEKDLVDGPGEPSDSDSIGRGVYDERQCSICGMTTGILLGNELLKEWSDVCNHLVCDYCTTDTLTMRNAGGLPIPDEDGVECPVEGCIQMQPAGECRAFLRAATSRRVASVRTSHSPRMPRSC